MPLEYKELYNKTKREFRAIAFKAITEASVSMKKKIYLATATVCPIWVAKFMAWRARRKFKADTMS